MFTGLERFIPRSFVIPVGSLLRAENGENITLRVILTIKGKKKLKIFPTNLPHEEFIETNKVQ